MEQNCIKAANSPNRRKKGGKDVIKYLNSPIKLCIFNNSNKCIEHYINNYIYIMYKTFMIRNKYHISKVFNYYKTLMVQFYGIGKLHLNFKKEHSNKYRMVKM